MPMEWLLTAPWETDSARRGDALGLGDVAEQFADILAPDLSNRTKDARWISILSWCLCMADKASSSNLSDKSDSSSFGQDRYEWIRPLELMWIYRTYNVKNEYKGYQLQGIRAIKRLFDAESQNYSPSFGLTKDQLNRYRFIGPYGSYRTMLRYLLGLTKHNDGWTPDVKAMALANLVSDKIEYSVPESIKANARADSYWRNHWPNWQGDSVRNRIDAFLPQSENEIIVLPEKERKILKSAIFGDDENGKVRKRVVTIILRSKAKSHVELCKKLSVNLKNDRLQKLSEFADLTESALNLLSSVWAKFNNSPTVTVKAALMDKEVLHNLSNAQKSAKKWSKSKHNILGVELCEKLAKTLLVPSKEKRLRFLFRYHMEFGSGLPWMCIEKDNIIPLLPINNRGGTPYRFRLWQLCRLAVQCGIISKMPSVLAPDFDDDEE